MQSIEGSAKIVNDVLRELFQGHGVKARAESGRITFPAHSGLWANGELFRQNERIIQLDVRLGGFDGERVLIESVMGFGADLNAQAKFALESFANASFHVLLPAFFGQPPCHGTERETWTIGVPRAVYPGLITSVFGFPPPQPDGTPDLGFFAAFRKRLEGTPLEPGTHWIRIYQMRHKGSILGNEVLLDNHIWEEMQSVLANYRWPVVDDPYDVRVFLVIKDSDGQAQSP